MTNRFRDAMYNSCGRAQCSPSLLIVAFVVLLVLLGLKFRATVIHAAELTLMGVCSALLFWLMFEIVKLVMRIRASDASRNVAAVAVSDVTDSAEAPAITAQPQPGSPEASEDAAIARARTALSETKKEGTP